MTESILTPMDIEAYVGDLLVKKRLRTFIKI
jgi:hypothetical protein